MTDRCLDRLRDENSLILSAMFRAFSRALSCKDMGSDFMFLRTRVNSVRRNRSSASFWPIEPLSSNSLPVRSADSSGRRNTRCLLPCMDGFEEFVQSLGGRFPAKGLSGSRIEGERDGRKDIGIMHAEISSLWKVLAQQAVGILVRAALPGAVRVAEVDMDPGVDPQMGVLSHLRALVPGQRLPQVLGQGGDRARDGIAHRLGTMAGERRSILDTLPTG